jgi:hypothetical protein
VDVPRVGLERDEQHDVVVDRRFDRVGAETVPARNLEAFAVLAAAEEAYVAEILDWCSDLDLDLDALAVRALDLLVRHLDEIGALEHGGELLDQLRIGAIDGLGAEPRVRRELRIEIVIRVPQHLEPVEIFVVIDCGQHLAYLPEPVALAVIRERAMLDQ